MKEDNTPQKLLFAFAILAAVSFAVWSGFATSVETPAPAAAAGSGLLTPF